MDQRLQQFFEGRMLRADERISLLKDVCADRTLMNDYVQGRNMLGMLALEIPDSESPDVTACMTTSGIHCINAAAISCY